MHAVTKQLASASHAVYELFGKLYKDLLAVQLTLGWTEGSRHVKGTHFNSSSNLTVRLFFLMALAERGVASNVPFASEFAKCVLPV